MGTSEFEPFTLRAHHVQLLIASQELPSPDETVRELIDNAATWRGDATRATANLERLAGEYTLEDRETAQAYGVDVLGDTLAQTQQFGKSVLDTLVQFHKLADDSPVELMTGGLDTICSGCAFQTHCRNDYIREEDTKGLEAIKELSTSLGIEDRITSAKDEEFERLHLSAGTLRVLMRCFRDGINYDIDGKPIL